MFYDTRRKKVREAGRENPDLRSSKMRVTPTDMDKGERGPDQKKREEKELVAKQETKPTSRTAVNPDERGPRYKKSLRA